MKEIENKIRCKCPVCDKSIYQDDSVEYYLATLIHKECLNSETVNTIETTLKGRSFADKYSLFQKLTK
jgi:hypothetical protein